MQCEEGVEDLDDIISCVEEKWSTLTKGLGVPSKVHEKWWTIIRDHYREKGRHYHTLEHIKSMLGYCDMLLDEIEVPADVMFAIFFHDIVYNPKASDNEERSASLFQLFCQDCLEENIEIPSSNVMHMIEMTVHHHTKEHDDDLLFGSDDVHYLLDFDMAILGQTPEVYERYSTCIRQEYIHIEDQTYKKKRAEVLTNFLTIKKIYCTKHFFHLYEDSARRNIKSEIMFLSN